MKKTILIIFFSYAIINITIANAEDFVFDGTDTSVLKPSPIAPNTAGSLFLDSSPSGNNVTVTEGSISGDAYGGVSDDAGEAGRNSLTITGGQIGNFAFGGFSGSPDEREAKANNNTVTVSGGEVIGQLFGGTASSAPQSGEGKATASYNTVNISGGNIHEDVYGGDGTVFNEHGGVTGAGTTASGNTVTISGGNVSGAVFGGHVLADPNSGAATAAANNNTVIISGGSVGEDIYGGSASVGPGANSGTAAANNNAVIISGDVSGNVLGGATEFYAGSGSSTATNNTVTITEEAILSAANTGLYGGYVDLGGSGTVDAFTGNTLNIAGYHSVAGIANFAHLNFTLPPGITTSDDLITAAEVSLGGTQANGGSTVSIEMKADAPKLESGTYTLIRGDFKGNNAIANTTATTRQGYAVIYDWVDIGVKNNERLTATLADPRLNPQTHIFMQGRAAGAALAGQGTDLLVGYGLKRIKESAELPNKVFVTAHGGSSRYETGSSFDLDSFTLMAGAAWGANVKPEMRVYGGAYAEAGFGRHSSSGSFSGMPRVKGSGDAHFFGAGVTGALELDNGFYTDASLRAGRVYTDQKTDLRFGGKRASYESSSAYYGGHARFGLLRNVTEDGSLDLYAFYAFTRVESDSVSMGGHRYRFDATDSHRGRGGVRYAHRFSSVTPYLGAAYEYEFDGKAEGRVAGYSIKPTKMRGGTAIGEVGLGWTPEAYDRFRLDFSVEGFAGKREGFMGHLRFLWTF